MLYNDLLKTISKRDMVSFLYLTNHYLKLSNEEKQSKKRIPFIKIIKLKRALKRSKKVPLQYIVGNVEFYGYTYKVNKNVLIPRFETEELVENAIKYIKENFDKNVNIIDIGTGSGCIGITLKKELPNSNVILTDISKKALKVAEYNKKDLDIKLINTNLLEGITDKVDVIISNPPYIAHDEVIDDLVKNNEPHIALYANNGGLYFYEEILKNANKILNKDFLISFEIGYKQKEDIIKLANKYLDNIDIICKKDMQDKNRMIFIMNKK